MEEPNNDSPAKEKEPSKFSFPAINVSTYSQTYEDYRRDMPCTLWLDMFMECTSATGRLRNYYKHGNFTDGRNCGEYSSELLFCIQQYTRTTGEQRKNFEERRNERLQQPELLKLTEQIQDIWKAT